MWKPPKNPTIPKDYMFVQGYASSQWPPGCPHDNLRFLITWLSCLEFTMHYRPPSHDLHTHLATSFVYSFFWSGALLGEWNLGSTNTSRTSSGWHDTSHGSEVNNSTKQGCYEDVKSWAREGMCSGMDHILAARRGLHHSPVGCRASRELTEFMVSNMSLISNCTVQVGFVVVI